MSNRYKKSGAGGIVLLCLVLFVVAIIQKIWPVLVALSVLWICYKLFFGKKKVNPQEKIVSNPSVTVTLSMSGKPTSSQTSLSLGTRNLQYSSGQTRNESRIKDYFIPEGQAIEVGQYKILKGMIYYVENVSRGEDFFVPEPSTIVPRLPIGTGFDLEGHSFSYWPSYVQIPPDAKNTYLKWLAEGADNPSIGIGYVFIYFYGLERRLVLDCQDEAIANREKGSLVREVQRLQSIYQDKSGSFRGYSSRLLQWASIDEAIRNLENGNPISIKDALQNDSLAALRISFALKNNSSLDVENTLLWFRNFHPGVARKYLIRDYFEYALKGFESEFKKTYPNGLPPNRKIISLELEYHGASIRVNRTRTLDNWPEPQKAFDSRVLLPLLKSLNRILDELAPHVRWFNSENISADPIEAISKRPRFLWPDFVLVTAQSIQNLIEESINNESGYGIVSLEKITKLLGLEKEKFTKKDQSMIFSLVKNLGYFADPDPDFFDVQFTPGDMLVITNKKLPTIKTGADFKLAVLTLNLCSAASWADGKVSPQETYFLETKILKSFKLSDEQNLRLSFYVQWLLAYDHHLSNFKRMVGKISKNKKRDIASLMIAIVAVDGSVSPSEVEFLEKTYKAFDLDKDSLYSDLHSFQSDGTDIQRGPTESVKLNQKKIQKKIEESTAVSSILADVFVENSETKNESKPERQGYGLEDNLVKLVRKLLSKDVWPLSEFSELAKAEGFLTNGAIESVNEWAFEELGDALIEETQESVTISSIVKIEASKRIMERV